jgi:hypothetical protein
MTIQEQYAEYEAWVATTPKFFRIDNTVIVYDAADVGTKVVATIEAKTGTSVSVQILDNTASLAGFLAWSEQICKC